MKTATAATALAGLVIGAAGAWVPEYHGDLLEIAAIGERPHRPVFPSRPTSAVAWVPPIGIPAPDFGIDETHTMYAGRTFDFGGGPEPYRDAGNGPYTHYVDNTSEAATDADNPFGTVRTPRKTLPTDLPAGSVVEVRGGPYAGEETIVLARGTAEAPVFIRGIGKPRIAGKLSVHSTKGIESTYLVVEGLDVFKFWVVAPASHLSYRHNDVHGDATNGGIGIDSYDKAYANHHLVFHDNVIHDNGQWHADYDQDVHGIVLARRTHHVWIVDNEFYHNSGDGVQINAGSLDLQPQTHHIYLGRNRSHHNKQAGLWCKQATDVIFSQNTVWGLRPIGQKPSAFGAGLGFQYGPERIWFLYNHVYDCCYGISSGSTSGLGSGRDCYLVGNVLHDIHHEPGRPYKPESGWSSAAVSLVGTTNRYVVNNTIYDCDAGASGPGAGRMVIVNNIIGRVSEPGACHVLIDDAATARESVLSNNLLYQDDGDIRIRWGTARPSSLAVLRVRTGQGGGCVAGDPRFENVTGKDWRLAAGSPAIDKGAECEVYSTFEKLYGMKINVDFAGVVRPQGTAWDIGAFERRGR